MSSRKLLSGFIGGVLLSVVLVGCSSSTPAPAPTVDFQQTIEVVKTQSAGTAVANITPNVCLPTETAVPTFTKTSLPTATLQPTATLKATNTLMPWWTKTPDNASLGCTITDSSPKVNAIMAPNTSFDGNWVVKNTGNGAWMSNEVDIRYVSGTKFQTKVDVVDMKNDVGEEESYTVVVDMKAPAAPGTYSTTWVVSKSGQVICSMPLTIIVQ